MYLLEDEGIPETKGKGMVNETASKDTKDKMLQGLSLYQQGIHLQEFMVIQIRELSLLQDLEKDSKEFIRGP